MQNESMKTFVEIEGTKKPKVKSAKKKAEKDEEEEEPEEP